MWGGDVGEGGVGEGGVGESDVGSRVMWRVVLLFMRVCVCAWVSVLACAYVRACVRAWACMCLGVWGSEGGVGVYLGLLMLLVLSCSWLVLACR